MKNKKQRVYSFTVDDKHIAVGKRRMQEVCPIALSMRERLNRPVRVKHDNIIVGIDKERFVPTPDIVRTFISQYDRGGTVMSITFDLVLPA